VAKLGVDQNSNNRKIAITEKAQVRKKLRVGVIP
jgi:hypothetical protein